MQDIILDSLKIDSVKIALDTTGTYFFTEARETDPNYGVWIPFLSALTGGVLVLAGQYLDRRFKGRNELTNNLREIYAHCRKLEADMKNNYRELAMFKLHAEYWWYCHNTQIGKDYKEKYYQDHLQSQTSAREVERRIGETKAVFIGYIRKFQVLQPIGTDIEVLLEKISDLTHKKAVTYDFSLSYEKVRNELVEKDEKELRNIYYKNLELFVEVNNQLFTLVNQP